MLYPLCRQSAITFLMAALIWMALDWAVSKSPNIRDTVDTRINSARLTHGSQLAHLVEEMHLLGRTDRPKLVFLGGSSGEYAFQVEAMEKFFPGYEIHSLCLNGAYGGGSSVETYEILKAAVAYIRPEALRRSVFVYGTLPILFSNSEAPLEAHFSAARRRLFPWLYKPHETAAIPRFGSSGTIFLHRVIRPFWILRGVYAAIVATNDIRGGMTWLGGNVNHALSELAVLDMPEDPNRKLAVEKHARAAREKAGPEGELHREKIAGVQAMLEFCDEHNLRFVLVVLPQSEMLRDETMAGFLDTMESMVAQHNHSGTLR